MKISPLFLLATTTLAQEEPSTDATATDTGDDYGNYVDYDFARGKRNKKKKNPVVTEPPTTTSTEAPTTTTTEAPTTTTTKAPTTTVAVTEPEPTVNAAEEAERGKKKKQQQQQQEQYNNGNNGNKNGNNNGNNNYNNNHADPYNNNDNDQDEHIHEHNWDGDEFTKPIDAVFKNFHDKQGQQCFTCHGANYDECYANGSMVACDDFNGSCLLEVRQNQGAMVGLQMGCHQPQSCLMQQWQNFNSRNWRFNQCKTREGNKKYSVCRLCSQEDDGFQSIEWTKANKMRDIFRNMYTLTEPQLWINAIASWNTTYAISTR